MRRTTRRKRPEKLSEVLSGWLKTSGLGHRLAQAGVVAAWPELVGPQIAAVAQADAVSADGTLWVRVASAAWRQELQLMTPDIIARINAGRKTGRIERIRWVMGG
jgi:predicted nucleic acid-binding Zn ribbon protein